MDELAEQVVDAINAITGEHPGHRAAHAKGTLLRGTFTPSGSGLTTAAHMQSEAVPVTARFSNGGGDPNIPDYAKEGRGLAVKFYLPDGSKTDIVSLSLPCFFVRTPEDFLEFTRLRKPDPDTGQPDFEKLGEWMGRHPEAGPAIQAALTTDPPESYATVAYNSIHSFRWTAPDGTERWVRYRFEPEEGERTLSEEAARALGRDYLQGEIVERASSAFRLLVIVASDEDDPDDPTVAWPLNRERVEVGRLELTGPETEREQGDDILVFDPTRVTDGID
ncbi:MAG TPA: catalase family peroxidase, partial [Thermoleophilaceae bacterium]|nr:catalase family peroxidase [Thermoleophilaceae bacterium]